MDLLKIQDTDYQLIVNYFHQYVDSKHRLESYEMTKILHMIITFCTVYPFRESNSEDINFNLILNKLQIEKRALFQLCVYNFAQSRVLKNSKTTIDEFGETTTCLHLVGEFIKNIFTDQKIITDCYLVVCNCYDGVFQDNSQFDNFINFLHRFIELPADIATFKHCYSMYVK